MFKKLQIILLLVESLCKYIFFLIDQVFISVNFLNLSCYFFFILKQSENSIIVLFQTDFYFYYNMDVFDKN